MNINTFGILLRECLNCLEDFMQFGLILITALIISQSTVSFASDRTFTLNGKVAFETSQDASIKQDVLVAITIREGGANSIALVRGKNRVDFWNYHRQMENGAFTVYTFYKNISGFEANGKTTNIVFKGRRVLVSKATGEAVYQGEILKVSNEELALAGRTLEESFESFKKTGKLDNFWIYFGLYDWK